MLGIEPRDLLQDKSVSEDNVLSLKKLILPNPQKTYLIKKKTTSKNIQVGKEIEKAWCQNLELWVKWDKEL